MKSPCKYLLVPLAFACSCLAQTINFDDLSSTAFGGIHDPLPAGYGGLNWPNFRVLDGSDSVATGYLSGTISAKNVIYNVNGNPSQISNSTAFDLNSAYASAAWNDGLQLEVQGFAGPTLVYDSFFALNTSNATFLPFHYVGVTEVNFLAYGGTHHSGFLGTGSNIALDNITVNLSASPVSPPRITNVIRAAGITLLSGDRGATNRIFYVVSSTNSGLPVAQWSPVATNQFDAICNFSATNAANADSPQQFYKLQVP